MTIERVQRAAELRGAYFSGIKRWQNELIGYGYAMYSPSGYRILQSDTLDGMYRLIMKYPKIRR